MGKYGSWVGMKSVIEMEVDEIKSILHPYNINQKDMRDVLDIVKNMAFEWCRANASARAGEEWAKDHLSEEAYNNYLKLLIPTSLDNYQDTYKKMLGETYPWYDTDPTEYDE